MNTTNYTIFEIIKYKIEFLECLEYSLLNNENKDDEIKKHLLYLNNQLSEGLYKEIIFSLFTSFKAINLPLHIFLSNYNYKKIAKLNKKKKLLNIIKYNESLIECNERFTQIIKSFINEEQIKNTLDKKIIDLIQLSDDHFVNFLFFNCYNLYLNCVFNKEEKVTHREKDIIRLIKILKYCNKNKKFDNYINVLKENNKEIIHKELENLSNECIKLEKNQYNLVNKLVNIINNEIKKDKN